jgi:hypothetical protein
LLREFDYAGIEIDGLRGLAGRSDRIVETNVSYIVLTGGRKITRAEMREATRPRFVDPNSRRWRDSMTEFEEREKRAVARVAERERKKIEVYTAGPEEVIGKPLPAQE